MEDFPRMSKKQKETCCRTQETRYQTAETSGNGFTGCALKFMKTNPTTKYVTARFPTRHVLFSLPRRLLSYILSSSGSWWYSIYMGTVTRAEGLTNLRSGGTYHARVSISALQLNLPSNRLLAPAVLVPVETPGVIH